MLIDIGTEYAIIALISLSKSRGKPVKISALARQEKLSETYLRKILQKLQKVGIVKTYIGPSGGVSLANSAKRISMDRVVSAVQGINMRRCEKHSPVWCKGKSCPVRKFLLQGENALNNFFKKRNIADLTTVPK